MRRQARGHQLQLLVEAYNKACDLINEKGVKHYKKLIMDRCQVRANVVDSLPSDLRFEHARGPRQRDMEEVRGKKDEVRSMK